MAAKTSYNYHDDQIETHNKLAQMVDNAVHSVAQLEEAVQERDATIARQSAALLSDLCYRGQLGEGLEGEVKGGGVASRGRVRGGFRPYCLAITWPSLSLSSQA